MKYLAIASLPLLFAGCQHLAYQPPADEDAATVTFTTNNVAAQPTVCVPGKGFQSTEYALAQKPFGGEALDEVLATMKKTPEVTTRIVPSEQSRIGVKYNRRSANHMTRDRCEVALQFHSQPHASYTARFEYQDGQCGLSLTDENGEPVDAVMVDWDCH